MIVIEMTLSSSPRIVGLNLSVLSSFNLYTSTNKIHKLIDSS